MCKKIFTSMTILTSILMQLAVLCFSYIMHE